VAAVLRPALGLPSGEPVTAGVSFYARAYAVRALPLSVLALHVLLTGSTAGLTGLLIVLGLIQVGDSALGIQQRNPGMAIGAGVAAAVHLSTALWLT